MASVSASHQVRGFEARVLWLLPIAFIIHDTEEIFTMPAWIADNQSTLQTVARLGDIPRRVVENLPTTTTEVATAVAVALMILVAATIWIARDPRRGPSLYVYSALLGVFVGHSLTHVAQAIVLHEYTPGVVSAVVLIPPVGFYLYRHLFRSHLLTWRSALGTAAVGMVAFLPMVVGAQYIGKKLSLNQHQQHFIDYVTAPTRSDSGYLSWLDRHRFQKKAYGRICSRTGSKLMRRFST